MKIGNSADQRNLSTSTAAIPATCDELRLCKRQRVEKKKFVKVNNNLYTIIQLIIAKEIFNQSQSDPVGSIFLTISPMLYATGKWCGISDLSYTCFVVAVAVAVDWLHRERSQHYSWMPNWSRGESFGWVLHINRMYAMCIHCTAQTHANTNECIPWRWVCRLCCGYRSI